MDDILKKFHEIYEEEWPLGPDEIMEGLVRAPHRYSQIILLLHGLNERGRRIYRKLIPYLPEDALVLAPNAPFPVLRKNDEQLGMGYAWYFYDREQEKYTVGQDRARKWIQKLLKLKNPDTLPVTTIGFSQGGYLAPLIGRDNQEINLVIAIGCEMREHLFDGPIRYKLETIHGKNDKIIDPDESRKCWQKLIQNGHECSWHLIEDAGHEISQSIGEKVQTILEQHGKRSL